MALTDMIKYTHFKYTVLLEAIQKMQKKKPQNLLPLPLQVIAHIPTRQQSKNSCLLALKFIHLCMFCNT
jgi:hypothetical protein